MLRLLKDSWEIIERLVRPLSARWEIAERSLKVRFPQRPLRDCFEPVQNLMKTMGTIEFTERSLKNHGRPWRSLSAHWKTVERSAKFVVSQQSRLCGKGVLTNWRNERDRIAKVSIPYAQLSRRSTEAWYIGSTIDRFAIKQIQIVCPPFKPSWQLIRELARRLLLNTHYLHCVKNNHH